MSEASERFRRAKSRKKTAPAKRVVPSAEAKLAYEALVRGRDEREQEYGRHLPSSEKIVK